MNIHLNSPAVALVWAEKRYGTKWSTEAFYRRYTDACKSFKDPLDPLYPFFKDHKNCPYDKGVGMLNIIDIEYLYNVITILTG